MRRALILQHMDHDHAGRFLDYFAEDGIIPDTVRMWEGGEIPPLEGYDVMLVLGGAMDAWQRDLYPWLETEMEAIRTWVKQLGRPYVGLCLGHQLLAQALGGHVAPAAQGEVGVCEITPLGDHPLFAGIADPQKVMQWHFAEVKTAPPGSSVLAASSTTAIQALAVGNHAIGLQFHAEFTPQTVAGWESLPNYIQALETARGAGAYERLKREALPLMPRMALMTRRIYDNLMRPAGLRKAA